MNLAIPRSVEVVSAEAVEAALDRTASEITARLAGSQPLIMTVMNGGELVWISGPHEPVADRTVLLLDDILDKGRTLAEARA